MANNEDKNKMKTGEPARELGMAKEVGYKGKSKGRSKGKRSTGAFHEVRREEESHRPMRHPRDK